VLPVWLAVPHKIISGGSMVVEGSEIVGRATSTGPKGGVLHGHGEVIVEQDTFAVRLADDEHGRNQASMLVNKMYSWRGYGDQHAVGQSPSKITLTAASGDEIVGTLTLSIDVPAGLSVDGLFRDEVDKARNEGRKVCEFTKLAIDNEVSSQAHFAALCHVAFIFARHLHGCTDLFIEVNPRHRRFYQSVLGFDCRSGPRTNPHVNAPAYLMRLDLCAFRPCGPNGETDGRYAVFRHFFSDIEVEGIARRLRG
jgi:hypothetical protein